MDIALTNRILHTASALAERQTADAVQVAVLKKALNSQATAAATLLNALPAPAPQATLAPSGTLGTQVNTYA